MSPELYAAINGLIRVIQPIQLVSPVPQWQAISTNVKSFEDILASDLFKSFSDSHKLLEFNSKNTTAIVKDIVHNGNTLVSKYGKLLKMKELAISLIPVTTTIVDSVFGKIPGKIAESLGKAFSDFLKEDKRITIYDYGDVHVRLLQEHYSSLASRKDILQPEGPREPKPVP
jgi:hypothetical protein